MERFARDVELLESEMTPTEVDDALAEHVKGTQLLGRGQRLDGATYYEPRRQHHSYDSYTLVDFDADGVDHVHLSLD